MYDFMHKQKGIFKLPALLKVAIDVSKGMNYLHQNNIIHRDLKAANLLMDENEVRTHFPALITYSQWRSQLWGDVVKEKSTLKCTSHFQKIEKEKERGREVMK